MRERARAVPHVALDVVALVDVVALTRLPLIVALAVLIHVELNTVSAAIGANLVKAIIILPSRAFEDVLAFTRAATAPFATALIFAVPVRPLRALVWSGPITCIIIVVLALSWLAPAASAALWPLTRFCNPQRCESPAHLSLRGTCRQSP